jgi:hypothetical protein
VTSTRYGDTGTTAAILEGVVEPAKIDAFDDTAASRQGRDGIMSVGREPTLDDP